MATDQGVIPSLMDVLSAAREDAGKELRHLRALTTKEERTLRRYENKENYPPGGEIDDLVTVYSEATGVSIFDLWNEAVERARKGAKRPTAAEAARAALPRGPARPKRQRHRGS